MRHAYLIMAHNEWEILHTLISCLDDKRNDIYVHVDAKVKDLPDLNTSISSLYILKDRINVRWGDYSQIEAELLLLKTAREKGNYSYYHLLSGVDLPLKSQNYINSFFEEHQGKEFIGFTECSLSPLSHRKVHRYHLFPNDFRNQSIFKRIVRSMYLKIQTIFNIERNNNVDFKKGTNWVSITEAMVDEVLIESSTLKSIYHHTFCCDEFFIQTLCWNSIRKGYIYNLENDAIGCMRTIGWRDGQLVDWCADDYDELKNSPALFARKFNSRDMEFIDKIVALTR